MDEPEVGDLWRERRKQYRDRVVIVEDVDPADITIRTVLTYGGRRPDNRPRTRVNRALWHKAWEPAPPEQAAAAREALLDYDLAVFE